MLMSPILWPSSFLEMGQGKSKAFGASRSAKHCLIQKQSKGHPELSPVKKQSKGYPEPSPVKKIKRQPSPY